MKRFLFGLAMLAIAACAPAVVQADQQEDKQIAQEVMQRLQEDKQAGRLKGSRLEFEVDGGTVWMSGKVVSKEQQSAVLEAARRISGVKQVVNDLTIAPSTASQTIARTSGTSEPLLLSEPAPSQRSVLARPTSTIRRASSNAPVAMRSSSGRPVPMGPSHQVNYNQAVGNPGSPQPMVMPSSGQGVSPARYDHPNMPGYAWPSYASSPNYGAVSYPKQYSPTAWPYIGPFYPYPQVPLGWRKVSLEWDDGWWFLDFKEKGHTRNYR